VLKHQARAKLLKHLSSVNRGEIAMPAKRIDPEDGKAYSWEEISAHYTGKYKKKDIEAYWENTCYSAKAAKGKEKAKAKAAPKGKGKEKAKAKAKVKENAKPSAAKAKAKVKAKKKQSQPRKLFKVCVVGGAGGIGQPLSLLMASNSNVKELAIIDLNVAAVPAEGVQADLSHIEGPCKVTSTVLELNKDKAIDKAGDALTGCDLVLVPAGVPRKPGQDRKDLLNINADIAKGTVEACAKYCPDAVVGLIVNPVNSVVPAMTELWKKAGLNPKKIVGITTLDIVRANKFVQEITGKRARVPVIGGHAGKTILPLFSQDSAAKTIDAEKIPDLDARVQDAGTEVVKAKNGKGSATLSMAYSGARLGRAVLAGLAGKRVVECAYVESSACEGLPYFASKVVFGKEGVEKVLPIGNLSDHEKTRLEELKPILKGEIDDGLEYASTREFAK